MIERSNERVKSSACVELCCVVGVCVGVDVASSSFPLQLVNYE